MEPAIHPHPQAWLRHVFSAKVVGKGGVIRRSVAWVDNEIGRDLFVDEVRNRGFHLIQAGGQFIVICSRHPIRRIV